MYIPRGNSALVLLVSVACATATPAPDRRTAPESDRVPFPPAAAETALALYQTGRDSYHAGEHAEALDAFVLLIRRADEGELPPDLRPEAVQHAAVCLTEAAWYAAGTKVSEQVAARLSEGPHWADIAEAAARQLVETAQADEAATVYRLLLDARPSPEDRRRIEAALERLAAP